MSINLKHIRYGLQLKLNRLLGKSFVEPQKQLSIEVSGLCNLLCRMCGYPKKTSGKEVLSTIKFAEVLRNAIEMGYESLALVPVTGDIFMDKDIHSKLNLVESNPRIKSYWFFTNFIMIKAETIELLSRSTKIGPAIYISIYGHDEESFKLVTQRPKVQFDRLLDNLDILSKHIERFNCKVTFCLRTPNEFNWAPMCETQSESNPLMQRLNGLFSSGKCVYAGNTRSFDSWGGLVTPKDITGLDFYIREDIETKTPKIGACSLIFSPIVLANGQVSACPCRATDGSLVIGNISDNELSEIISINNSKYKNIIHRHQAGDFPTACSTCTEYRSIYRKPHSVKTVSIEHVLTNLIRAS